MILRAAPFSENHPLAISISIGSQLVSGADVCNRRAWSGRLVCNFLDLWPSLESSIGALKRIHGYRKGRSQSNPAETDSAQTNESVEISKSENRIEKDPSYMRGRQIALKKFTPPE
jgi:hypothetical protein